MLLGTVKSVNGSQIRLTEERHLHIVNAHLELLEFYFAELLSTIESPDLILQGWGDELLAVRYLFELKRYLVVIYKEEECDGFIITSYLTSDEKWLFKRKIIWKK